MPNIVKKCVESIANHSNGHPVNLITIDNYSEYMDIDARLLQRYYDGTLLPAHLADLFRLKLLADYGGLWIDATIYLIKDLEDIYFNKQFFSIKNYPISAFSVTHYKWISSFLGATVDSPYFKHLAYAFEKYLIDKKRVLHYLMIDYFIDLLYKNDESLRAIIDSIPVTNEYMHTLRENFNKTYNVSEWQDMTSNTSIFKLTYKGEQLCDDEFGNKTFYGFIMSI